MEWIKGWKKRKPEIICGLLCFFSIACLASILIRRHLYVRSSYAVLQAYFIPLSSQIDGEITHVYVKENQAVRKGQVLCAIDDRPYLSVLKEAESRRDALLPQIKSAQTDLRRMEFLLKRGSISPSRFDSALATVRSLESRFKAARALASVAKLNVSRTRIVAPTDGLISFRSAQIGTFASTTTPLFGFIANQERWIEAKIKETDLSGIQVGDSARIRFDALPGREFQGHLESLSQSTESPFSAVPDDFSSGNFSKYTQWLPVRIRLDLDPSEKLLLPVGINSDVQMKRRRS